MTNDMTVLEWACIYIENMALWAVKVVWEALTYFLTSKVSRLVTSLHSSCFSPGSVRHLEWACGLSSLGQRCGMPGCPYGNKPVTLADLPCCSWQPSIPGGVLESTLWTMMISRAVMYWESSSVFAGESCHIANAIGARTMCAGKGRNMVVNLAV